MSELELPKLNNEINAVNEAIAQVEKELKGTKDQDQARALKEQVALLNKELAALKGKS